MAMVELTLLAPHHSMGVRGVNDTDLDFGLRGSPRISLAYNWPDGLGACFRYWAFDEAASAGAAVAGQTDSLAIDAYVFDAELTATADLNDRTRLLLAGGVRHTDYEELALLRNDATGAILNGHRLSFSGTGVISGADLRHDFFPCLTFVTGVRGTILSGDQDEFGGATLQLVDEEMNDIKFIFESRLGIEATLQLPPWGEMFASVFYEFQYWDSFSGEPLFDGGEAVGFAGLTVAGGLRY